MRGADSRVVLGLHRSGHSRDLFDGALKLGIDAIDTSYNYLGFTSHRTLAGIAGDLLPHFSISTKVGFIRHGDGHTGHTLEPVRLRRCVEETVRDLGRIPDLVFLHNPERSLINLATGPGLDLLLAGCASLDRAMRDGLCTAWGIATWTPGPVLAALANASTAQLPSPTVLMTRAGLTVDPRTLDAADDLAARLRLHHHQRWGMSPFGGDVAALREIRIDPILRTDPPLGPIPTALRTAYLLPCVHRIAVGTDNLDHLQQLAQAAQAPVAHSAVDRYRRLLRERDVARSAAVTGA